MSTEEQQHSIWFHLLDVILNIVIIVAIVAAVRTFLVSPFQVEGNSMVDTLEHKQYIIINKLAYHLGDPERGDVVVFKPPNAPNKHYVKRVIGIPGDEVVIRDGHVFLRPSGAEREVKITEKYLNESNADQTYKHPPTSGNTSEIRYKVPEEGYFLLGDNRKGSLDSRSFSAPDGTSLPFVIRKNVKGRVWFVALPITKIHALEPPNYDL